MKKVGTYTCRGTVTADDPPHRINLFDGSFKTGYVVREFVVAAYDIDNVNVRTFAGKLGTVDSLSALNWNWADQRELAWAWFTADANGVAAPNHFSQVDSDAMIVEDVYLYADEPAGATTGFMNYMITFDKYEFSDWKGALSMARDKQAD
jgi:hypothetical protein